MAMFDAFSKNYDQLALNVSDCLNIYKTYLLEHRFQVTQFGNTQLIGIRNEDNKRIVIMMEGISNRETKIAISQVC